MNAFPPKKITISINPIYGIIYGGIIIFLLMSSLVISETPLLSNLINTYSKQSIAFNPFVCTFKKITGLPCMTCGGTRSFFYFAHLKFKNSFSMNPLVFLTVTILLLYGLISVISFLTPKHRVNPLDSNSIKKELKISIPIWLKNLMIILAIGSLLINWAYLVFISKP
jgi:hypothetical protein